MNPACNSPLIAPRAFGFEGAFPAADLGVVTGARPQPIHAARKNKGECQWKMYAVVHNMLKAYRYVPRDVAVYGAHGIGMGGVGPDETGGMVQLC